MPRKEAAGVAEAGSVAGVAMESTGKAEPDQVAMPSLLADGSPDQSEGFRVIGEAATDVGSVESIEG